MLQSITCDDRLQKLFDLCNKHFYDGALIRCAITIQSDRGKGKNIKWNGMEKALAKNWKHILE